MQRDHARSEERWQRWRSQFQRLANGSFKGQKAKLLKKCTETFWVCSLGMNITAQTALPLNEKLVKESSGVGCQIGGPMGVLITLAKRNIIFSIDFSPFFCLLLRPLIRISRSGWNTSSTFSLWLDFFFAFGICCYLFKSLSRYNRVSQQPAKPKEEFFKFTPKPLTRPLLCFKSSRRITTVLKVRSRLLTD